jgi:hypothetical protein
MAALAFFMRSSFGAIHAKSDPRWNNRQLRNGSLKVFETTAIAHRASDNAFHITGTTLAVGGRTTLTVNKSKKQNRRDKCPNFY